MESGFRIELSVAINRVIFSHIPPPCCRPYSGLTWLSSLDNMVSVCV